ncbi:hypothetical protein JYU34_013146 [Plutella xylostella]|uniref:RNA-directed DNA polymerase n=1 Tax=Plutella xylostella TaxID=51655 RepID=A0ABQ7QD14_PLUXY|nr:hypothetical protein JYU34_013146 [Plutella xylostella]
MSSTALTLENFECDGDATSVVARWQRWKRALYIFLDASGTEKSEVKRAKLLHFGGFDLQEIYYNIPGANAEPDNDVDVFKVAIEKLDAYFAPKQSKIYERHVFRLMKQETGEKFEKFVVRLRQQAEKCQFHDSNENIMDQIAEKCSNIELRKKILKTGDAITLDQIIMEANTLESVDKQLEEFVGNRNTFTNQSVNKIESRRLNFWNKKPDTHNTPCGRCGNQTHNSFDINCPARAKECLKCGIKGHFRQFCRTKYPTKRKFGNDNNSNDNKSKTFRPNTTRTSEVNQVDQQSNERDPQEKMYVFHIDDDVEFDCSIGGVKTKVLVDSGCKLNLLTESTWNNLKSSQVSIHNQIANPEVTLVAYGSNTPLDIIGSFEAHIIVGNKTQDATFYVIKNGTKNLLGKNSAMSLGILKIGIDDINNVSTEVFPKFKNIMIELPIDDNIQPISQPYRRIPIPLEEKVSEKIDELVKRDIIEEVRGSSKWVSPIVPILKENGEVRVCVDMRRANEAIVRENHPLPTMDKLLPQVRQAKYFTKLDIKDAFHQIEIHPDSRHITTFIASKGLFRYKRLMFGISCAPEIFQKILERMLLGCEGVVNFIDDILTFGKDSVEHDIRLQKVMQTLEENNVVLRKEKCIFKVTKVCFLGHELTSEGVRPLPKYVDTIQQFRPPTTMAELQSFLGLVNYVSKWIPNYATLTEPLKTLLRNKNTAGSDISKIWGTQQQEAFNNLKFALQHIPTLGYYNVNDRTVVIADASPVALGAVLIQIDDKGARIIAYGHKTLTGCERRYCQTEKEALALVWAVEHFHMFLYGKDFELVTDHKPLEVIFGPKSKPCARIERWILRLQSYRYKVVYKPGKSNIADPLSRLCDLPDRPVPEMRDNHVHQIVEFTRPKAVSMQEIIDSSGHDQEIKKVKAGIFNGDWDEEVKLYRIFQNELCFYEGILLRGTRIVIPAKLRERVLQAAHEGHPGIVAMKARLRTKVWWPGCDKDAEKIVKCCKGCTLVAAPNPPNPLKRRCLPEEPWVDIAIDLMGPLPSNEFILVVVDYFSRYKEIKICRKITSTEIINHLKEIFSRVGHPLTITADNGRQFTSLEFKEFCEERNITLHSTIPYWPQQNGEVERQNRDILKRLKISQTERKNWKESLLEYLIMYNSTPHSVTGKTPSELFYRRKFRDKIPMVTDAGNKSEDSTKVKDRDQEWKEKGKIYADRKRRAQECDLEPGDKVYVKNMIKENKLSLNYDPTSHTVRKCVGGDLEVQNDETGQTYRRNIVHLKKVQGQWTVHNKVAEEEEDGSDESSQ